MRMSAQMSMQTISKCMRVNRRRANALLWTCLLALPGSLFAQGDSSGIRLKYHGAGWVEFGKVENSYEDLGGEIGDYNKNWLQDGGGQFGVIAKVDSNWEGAFQLGIMEIELPRGTAGENGQQTASLWYPFWTPYVSEARVTYSHPVLNHLGKFQVTLGEFTYNYSPDAKNLGLYLMNGYVYPGALESGFGGLYGGVDASEFGGLVRYEVGGFHNDILLKTEDERPDYDWSLLNIASYTIRPGLEIGAGVDFYRLIANNSSITSPGTMCGGLGYGLGECSYTDTVGGKVDTITGSLAGTKVMARFHLDPKALFGFSKLGPWILGGKDLTLYGEAAIIGLKNYPIYYDDIWQRIPVMMGFDFPAFGYLDYLSAEVEYYGSKNSSDDIGANFGGSWIPDNNQYVQDYNTRDNWKWSVNLARTLFGHLQFSAQVADDHLRLGGTHDLPWVGGEVLRTPDDWYWTCKLAYFF